MNNWLTSIVFVILGFATTILNAGGVDEPKSVPVQSQLQTEIQASTQVQTVDHKQLALAAYEAKNYVSARERFLPLAENGDAEAQYYIGRMYEKGYGVERDDDQVRKWYRLAANGGYPKAQYKVAVGYARGLAGLKHDEIEAGRWLLKSAQNGYRRAQKTMYKAYQRGKFGFPKDKEQARRWRERYEANPY
jgi:TPR repeat protein